MPVSADSNALVFLSHVVDVTLSINKILVQLIIASGIPLSLTL